MPQPIDTTWFRHRIEDKKISQRKLAVKLDLDPAAVSLMIRGKRKMSLEEAARLSEVFGVPVEEVMERGGIEPPKALEGKVPVVGWADNQGLVHIEQIEGPLFVPSPPGVGDNASALRLLDGWVVYYTRSDRLEPEAVGRLAVIQTAEGGPRYMRILNRGYEPGKWNLTPFRTPRGDAEKVDGVRIDWAAPVSWIRT
ncbi:helix-turn-helix domain-containing protein [Nitrosovibrio sp. Nv4]|uniref:helix-turn-helix domain-containing protein n=1 Tax=Nitrosovibrio sp. Nv4 TaxID=1945880 RepID=UPI000BD71F55|nr:helix-turn-helix transcriptional regulator [Nitrosovibrio sp. Nv4]SOD41340.1 Helix-turn-helix [Nitrosovibrio sp. Nv4]